MKRSVDLAAALQVLELSHTPENVKRAYRRLSKQRHPDAPGGSHEEFIRVREAYECAAEHMHTKDDTKDEQQDRDDFSSDCYFKSSLKEALLFIEFLKKNGLMEKYKADYEAQGISRILKNYVDFICIIFEPACALKPAFVWNVTFEGGAFWVSIDKKWLEVIRNFLRYGKN